MSMHLKECPLCGGQELVPFMVTRDRHYGIPGDFSLSRCVNCRLVFLNPMYSDCELGDMYPTDYYAYQDVSLPRKNRELVKRMLGYEIRTKDPKFRQPGKALDIGCGTGWFLRRLREDGWDVCGVEINEAAARLGRENYGIDIFGGSLLDASFASESFDYIRLNHSFEHITRPNETLAEIYRILKPDGLLMIGVPNHASLNARLFGRYWWYLGAPVHPFTYCVENLSKLLDKQRFSVRKVTYNSDYSGILGSLQIYINRNNRQKSTDGFLINSLPLRLLCHWCAKLIDLFQAGDAIELIASKSERCGARENRGYTDLVMLEGEAV